MKFRNISQKDISGYSDQFILRRGVSDILNHLVHNHDVVKMREKYAQKTHKKLKADVHSKKQDSKFRHEIQKTDTGLLAKPPNDFLHTFVPLRKEENERPSNDHEISSQNTLDSIHRLKEINSNDLSMNQQINKEITVVRYRESVFQAATRISKEAPTFPIWAYKDESKTQIKTKKINVGGKIFEIFDETLYNISDSKLHKCLNDHNYDDIVFIDRDPVCFNSVLNFYRTGRLHSPPNVCLTFFEEELLFWGINEYFMEPCCWSDYQTYKIASNKLKKYSEDSEKNKKFVEVEGQCNFLYRKTLYKIMSAGSNSKAARVMSLICAVSIIVAILCMIIATTPLGRTDKVTEKMAEFLPNESVSHFLEKSKMNSNVAKTELLISGYFFFDIASRMILCPDKFEFFSDSLNWIDIIATFTSIVGATPIVSSQEGPLEAFILFLKLPRILRLFRLTENLRSGMGAFTLTIKACFEELKLVFMIMLVATVMFGVVIFAVEIGGQQSTMHNIFVGMWWSVCSMAGVGYGDYVPKTSFGYLIGGICIMIGVIICQMPVPIFLKNFSIYYNQASARLISQSHLLLCENVDKREIRELEKQFVKINDMKRRASIKNLKNLFSSSN